MNVLVAYVTKEGQTEKIARRVADTVVQQGHQVVLIDLNQSKAIDIARFDAVLVGAPVHGGRYPRALRRFFRQHRAELGRVRTAFFSVCLGVLSRTSDGRALALETVERLVASTGFRPQRVELVAGALLYTQYNFLIRYIMRRITAGEGGDTDTSRDYEYTDWAAVERFAREFVAPASVAQSEQRGDGQNDTPSAAASQAAE